MSRKAQRVVRGQALLAEDWNDILRRLVRVETNLRSLQGNRIPATLTAFTYHATAGDAIEARTINDDETVGADVYLAKPWTHRPSRTTRGLHTYSYITDYERTDTFNANVETQVLTPAYVLGDLIFATRVTRSTYVTINLPVVGDFAVMWQQVNVEGRAWAQKYEPP